MKTVNMEREVVRKSVARKSTFTGLDFLQQTQKLLEFENTRDNTIMRKLAPNCTEVYVEKERAKILELENLEKTYGDKIISVRDIRVLAENYRLRFLPSIRFSGSMAPDVVATVRRYADDKGIDLNDHTLDTRFYILAPAEMFNLSEGVKRQDLIQESEEAKRAREARIQRMRMDPSIFYKISETEFVHLKTWGKDFSILRRIKGAVMKNHKNFFFTMLLIAAVVVYATFAFVIPTLFSNNQVLFSILGGIIPVIFAFIALFSQDGFFSSQVWNSAKKNEDRMIIIN